MPIELILTIITGLVFGSFVTLVSWRLPRGEDIVVKPSRCPQCDTKLRFGDLWPVLSWVVNRGKCRYCAAPVSVRYPLTEIATAAGFALVYMQLGLTPLFVIMALMWVTLLVMMVVDLEHYIIPDQVHYVLIPLGLGWHYVQATPRADVLAGLALGGGIGLALHYGYRWLRNREGLGFGDVKFFAVAGLWLGLKPIVPFLFLAGVLGIVTGLLWRVMGRGPVFPFGPALALSLFLCVLYPQIGQLFWNIGRLAQ